MAIVIGSARLGENGKATGGAKGDSKQKSTPDYIGEVSMQNFYVHSLGWVILRPTSASLADKLADAMKRACNNPNIGYNQNDRLGIIKYGVDTKTKCNADCSSTVRACCIASGFDTGNFTTVNEASVLIASGKFTRILYSSNTPLYNGDVLVTKTKGHTAIVVSGNPRAFSPVYGGVNYSAVFDATYYAQNNEDVRNALGTNATKLFEHFTTFGMKEGRQAKADFNVKKYKANYDDLQNVFGNDLPSYYKHYCQFGKAEGRKGI